MSRAVLTLIVAAALIAASAAPANAATPFTAGVGAKPSVAVGSDNSGHVVWDTSAENDGVGYCRVAAGATACNLTQTLSFPGVADAHTTGRPVVFTPVANKVVVVAGCWNCGAGGTTDRTYSWISLNNGDSFAGPDGDRPAGSRPRAAASGSRISSMFVGAERSRVRRRT